MKGISSVNISITPEALKIFSLQKDVFLTKTGGYWEFEGFAETGKTEAERVALLADLSNVKSTKTLKIRILDLGCGRGRLAQGLLVTGQKDSFHYVGIDNNKEDIEYCNKAFIESGWEFSHFDMKNSMYNAAGCQCDQLNFPYQGRQFDIIYSWSVFSHLEPSDIDYYLGLFRSLLKPQGVLFLTFHANLKCEKNPTYNPEWWSFEGGGKILPEAPKLLVVAYHPNWIKSKLQEHGYKIFFEHYPILASNYQTGYYLTTE